jgi:ectoine hydroxylase-related dioxygenase (phytanoyl-CoA dioxygenase family)
VRDGYALLPGWLAGDDLAAARAAAAQVVAAGVDAGCPREHNTLLPLRWRDDLVALLLAAPERTAALRAALAASDLRWTSGYVSVKDPGSGPLEWHRDWWCWDHPVSHDEAAPQVALLVYLSDTDERNGALRVRPGSHRGERGEAVTLAARAGDAVAIDYRLDHGTHPNAADRRRDAVILNFAPDWAALPADIRGHLISHHAQPAAGEDAADAAVAPLLPRHDGPRRDLPLNRTPAWEVAA